MSTDDEDFHQGDDFADYEYDFPAYPDYYYEVNGDRNRSNTRWNEQLNNLTFTAIKEKKFKHLKNLLDSSNLSLKTRFNGLCYAVSCNQMGTAKLILQSTPHSVDQVRHQFYSTEDDRELVLGFGWTEGHPRFHEFFLALAVDRGNEKVVRLLLNEGANVHFKIENKYDDYWDLGSDFITPSDTSILIAMKHGNVQIVEQLLIHGADVNSRYLQSNMHGYEGCTLLHIAVKIRSKPIIKLLLLYGADINATENNGLTPLHIAAQTAQFKIIKYLVKEGAYINPSVTSADCQRENKDKRNLLAGYLYLASNLCYNEATSISERGYTSLQTVPQSTIKTRCPEIVAYILDRYPDTNDENNKAVLFSAISLFGTENDKNIFTKLLQYEFWKSTYSVRYEDINILAELLPDEFEELEQYESVMNYQDKNNIDSIFNAVRGNFFDTVKLLLKNGAEVNKEYDGNDPYFQFCSSLLHVAVIMGDIDMVRLLIEYGADLDARNMDGKTPLLCAVALSESEIATLLLKNGAKIFDEELLILAVEKSSFEVIQILLEKDININEEVKFKKNLCEILSYSRTHGRLPRSYGDSSNFSEDQPTTALHVAANIGRYEVVKLLLNHGAEANGNSLYHKTPLYFSACNGHFETVQLLLKSGANITHSHAHKAFHEAAKAGHAEVVELLIEFGIEIDKEDDEGNTPLINSVETKRWEVIEVLLRSGANIQKCTRLQLSPLDIAIHKADDKAVKLLLKHGAKGGESRYFKSSIAIFTRKQKPAIVDLLLKSGANINTSNWWGGSLLSTAAEMNSEELVKLLLDDASDTYEVTDYVKPLLISAEKGNLKIIERLLNSGACINFADKKGQTAIFKAAEKGQTETVLALLKYGTSVNCKTLDGETPLSISASKGHLEIVQVLLKSNADIDSADNRGRTPIYNAARKGHVEIVRLLLKNGAAVDIKNKDDETPFFISATRGHLDIVETLLDFKVYVDSTDKNGKSPLYKAAENGHVAVVKRLLQCGAAADIKIANGKTPLIVSAGKGHLDIVEILITFKADINSADDSGQTPLYTAVKYNQLETVKLLMENGATIETRTADGKTPLLIAIEQNYVSILTIIKQWDNSINSEFNLRVEQEDIQQGNIKMIQLLLEHGAAVDCEDMEGNTPLIISMKMNKILVSETLLKYGASTEYNLFGETPLHLAVKNCDIEGVKLLLEYGANVDPKAMIGGETPLLISVKKSELKMIEILLEAGADVNAADYSERTSLYIAVHETLTHHAVQLLLDYGAEIDSKTLNGVKTGGLEYHNVPTILCHIVKMKMANLYKGADFVGIENNRDRLKILEFQERCMVQVKKMMDQYIDDTTVTFYEILTKNLDQLARFAKTKSAAEILKTGDHRVKFPIYADNIEIQIQKGIIRKNLMEQGIKVYNFLISRYTDLPYELMEKILCHLNNNELRMLINSCKPILALLPTGTRAVLSPSLENLDLFDTSEDWISRRNNHK